MFAISTEKTVGELVVEVPGRSRVFEEMKIDYCCGGSKTLSDACARRGVDVDVVLAKLDAMDAAGEVADVADYGEMPLNELVDHIVDTHHVYLRSELPRLEAMSKKVASVHGEKDERLVELNANVSSLVAELTAHMMKEEQILFPVICQLATTNTLPKMPFGTLANPIRAMEEEHDSAGNGLETAHRLTDGYVVPEKACNTHRALLDGLKDLELDLHQHIHKENNILFPRALELEMQRRG